MNFFHLLIGKRKTCSGLLTVSALVLMGLSACGGGGAGSVLVAPNASVAAQVNDLQPENPEDTVGAFVDLQVSTPALGANAQISAQDARKRAQDQFLNDLQAAVRQPASGASSTPICDAASLSGRLDDAYKPSSGAAVRIDLNACELKLLPTLKIVKGVYEDIPLAPSAIDSNAVALFNQAVVDGFGGAAWPRFGTSANQATGANTVIAVMDTGVEDRHPAFSGTGKVLPGACFSTPSRGGLGFCPVGTADTSSSDAGRSCMAKLGNGTLAVGAGCGHGTSMAATAAMAYANASVSAGGVAKAAAILPVQVFNGANARGRVGISANSGDLLRGIEWVTAQAQERKAANLVPIVALNISLGGGAYSAACDNQYVGSLFYTAFKNLRAQGVMPVVAAGNSGNASAISFPACVSNAFTVGAAKLGGTAPASYSNFSDQVRLFAIGGDIGAAYNMPTVCTNVNFDCWSGGAGTSPAAAMVSGAVAVLRASKPEASLADIEAALQTSDKTLAVGNVQKPLLNIAQAGAQLLGVAVTTPTPAPAPAPTPTPTPTPAPVALSNYTRMCIYSLPNYQGQRACGIFAKDTAYTIAGSWTVASLQFFEYDPAKPYSTKPLVADTFPKVSLFDTISRLLRDSNGAVLVSQNEANLTNLLPSKGKVRLIIFSWGAN